MSMANLVLTGVDDTVLITVCIGAVLFLKVLYLTFTKYLNSSSLRASQETPVPENQTSYNNDICPICLEVHRLAVETNCGHKFCGTCLNSYVNRTPGDFSLFSNPISCPLCRQEVNILLLSFTTEDYNSVHLEEERSTVERLVHEYNIRYGSGPGTISSYIRDCPVLIRHMFTNFFTFGGLVWVFRLRIILCCVGALLYFFSPLDIIPEAVFGMFGFLDDVIIFVLDVIYVSIIYRRSIVSRATAST